MKYDPTLTLDSIPKEQRIIVCGGRDFYDGLKLFHVLDMCRPREVAHGGARGADTLAGSWAESRGIPLRVYPADWARYGRSAGPMRNRHMLDDFDPDGVVSFPGGRGTDDMCSVAQRSGVWVVRIG